MFPHMSHTPLPGDLYFAYGSNLDLLALTTWCLQAGFAEPAFDGRFGVLDTRVVGGRHLKLRVRAPSGETTQVIAFRYLDDPQAPAIGPQQSIDLVYRAALDEYGGGRRLQLVAEWLSPAVQSDPPP
jgi:hypothetical protein